MEVLKLRPLSYWVLDGSAPFTDYTGYNTTSSGSGTESRGVGLTSKAAFSQILSSSRTLSFGTSVYTPGKENNDFSLMATVFPVQKTSTGDQQILSNQNRYDGLSINGTVVSFSTQYASSGEAKASYDLRYYRRADLFGIHTKTKNSLYVNGALVAEVNITPTQQADTYAVSTGSLYSGNTSSTQGLMLNSVAIFGRAVLPEEILSITGKLNNRFVGSPARALGGTELPVSILARKPYINVVTDTEEEWRQGQLRNCFVKGTALVPEMFNSLTIGGVWQKSFDLYNAGVPTPIECINIQWVGQNVTVEVSLDDVTWNTVTPGVNLPQFTPGFDPTGKSMTVRITFVENATDAFIDDFKIRGYVTNQYVPTAGRTLTYTSAVQFENYKPLDLVEDWGVQLFSGKLSWSDDSSSIPLQVRTVEAWVKKNGTTEPTLSFTPSATYIDGSATGSSARGEWALYHWVLPADAATFEIGGDITVGAVYFYPRVLTAAEILTVYTNYTGVVTTRYGSDGVIVMSESSPTLIIYAHDWSS